MQNCLQEKGSDSYHIVIIDDSVLQCRLWTRMLYERYGERVFVEYFTDPNQAIADISEDVSLVLIDLEMPHMDGHEIVEALSERGIERNRMIVLSSLDIGAWRHLFAPGDCLAIMQKGEPHQHEALMLILDELTDYEPLLQVHLVTPRQSGQILSFPTQ